LLRIQCKIITQYAGGFLSGDLGHDRHIVQKCRDIVDEGKQAGSGHDVFRVV